MSPLDFAVSTHSDLDILTFAFKSETACACRILQFQGPGSQNDLGKARISLSVLSFIQSASGNLSSIPVSISLKHFYRGERFWCFKEKLGANSGKQ